MAGSALPLNAMAAAMKGFDTKRSLAFYNIHTNEDLHVTYFQDGVYSPEALSRINHILRDYRTDSIKPIDTELLDLLFAVKCRVLPRGPFHVISGYRSPATNEMLRRRSTGVAKASFHTVGKAVDIRLPDYNTARLKNLCIKLKAGGVGYYDRSDFVHLDIGPVRTW